MRGFDRPSKARRDCPCPPRSPAVLGAPPPRLPNQLAAPTPPLSRRYGTNRSAQPRAHRRGQWPMPAEVAQWPLACPPRYICEPVRVRGGINRRRRGFRSAKLELRAQPRQPRDRRDDLLDDAVDEI